MEAEGSRNCLILGAGRSGTSLVAGMFSDSGYHMGDDLLPPAAANPRGFFESNEINLINEKLLYPADPPTLRRASGRLLKSRFNWGHRWLADVPLEWEPKPDRSISRAIERITRVQPFCFKDPRFCYTLPAWISADKETFRICVFRDPESTAASIVKVATTAPYLKRLGVDTDRALSVWAAMYEHVLKKHADKGDWAFIHVDQVVTGDGVERLEEALNVSLARTLIHPQDLRQVSTKTRSPKIDGIYAELCARSSYIQRA